MSNSYKIDLGISLNQGDLGKIKTQLNNFQNQKKIELEINRKKIDNQLNSIRKQIQNLSNIKIDLGGNGSNSLSLNTEGLDKSLKDIATSITTIKNALGTLDSGGEMKSLLSSVNQISTALDKTSTQFAELNTQLSALSKKDFSVNIGVKLGGSNSVNNNIEASDVIRNQIIPELQKQEKALAQYLAKYYNTNELSAVSSLLTKSGNNMNFGDVWAISDKLNSPIKKGELNQRMQDLRNYINLIKQAAAIEGVDLTPVVSKFNGQADDLVKQANDIRNGAKQAEDGFEKLKSVLGSSIDGEGLSKQLDSIVADLNEIKTTFKSLSESISIDEITTAFREMSVVLTDITDNLAIFRNALGNVGNGLGGSIGSTTQELKNNANILDTFKRSLQNIGMGNKEIDSVANRIKNLGVQIETINQSKPKKGVLSVDISGIDKFGNAVKITEQYSVATGQLVNKIEKVSTVQQKAGASTNNFAKQQKTAVSNLTNQINKLNRAAKDQNASRPIKDTSHLDSLAKKYDEIINAIQRMESASSDTFVDEQNNVKKLISEYKSLVSEYRNAENVALQMDGNDFASGLEIAKNKLAEFKAQAQGFPQLTQTIKNLDNAIEGVGDVSSLKEFNNQLRVAKSELSKIKAETAGLDKIKFGLIDEGADGFKQAIASRQAAIDKLKQSTPELQVAMNNLRAAMSAMDSANQANDVQRLKAAYDDYNAALKAVDSQLRMLQQAESNESKDASFIKAKEGALLRLKSLFSANSEAAKKFSGDVDQIQRKLNACGDTKGLTEINRDITNLSRKIKQAGVQTETFGQKLKKQWEQYKTYLSVASLISYGTQALRSMFEQVKLIDSAMTELKKVTNETDEAYEKFLTNAADRAREIGTTIDGLVSSTADFARLGYGFEDAQGLAEVANIYAVVGDEIEGVEGATESLISTMAAFKGEMNGMSNTDFAMSIIDKFNEIGNNFAISSGGIGEALERSASSLMAANNTIDESIALITAANTVVVLCHAA